MSTFYSELADSVKNDLEKVPLQKKSGSYFEEDGEDLDDLLNDLELPESSSLNKSNLTKNTITDSPIISAGLTKINGTKHDIKHTNNTTMSRSSNKSRKSVLDQLIEPFGEDDVLGSPGTKQGTERNQTPKTVGNNFDEETENRTDSLPVSNSIKRTVRFSDSVKVDLFGENGQSVAAEDKPKSDTRPLTADRSKPPVNPSVRSRPHTAPGLSTDVKSSLENLLLDDVSPERPRQTDEMDEFAKVFQSTSRTRIRRPSSLDSIGRSGDSIGFASKQWKEGRKTEAENHFKSQENLSTFVNVDLEARMKRMELEKANLESLLELMKKQHQEELSVVEQAAKSKVELIEEGAKRRESRLKEELKYLEEQRKERLAQLEQQRDQLASELTTKLNEARSHGDQEMARVKALHEDELNRLKMSQEQTIEQVRQACEQEMRVRGELQPNTEQLKRLLEMLSNAAQELSHVEQERSREFTARNEQLIRRENALRIAEEKFSLREDELDHERKQTTDILAKLEVQLKENAKLMAEDRWSIKQEQNRLAKLQTTLEEERRSVVEQAGRERGEIHELVNNFLAEHRRLQAKNCEERSVLAAEHQKLRSEQIAWEETRRADEERLRQAKEEINAMKETLTAERRRLDERVNQLRIDEVKLEETRRQLDIVRCDLAREQESLNSRNEYVSQQLSEINQRAESVAQAERALDEAEARQRKLQTEQGKQFSELQIRMEKMHEAETKLIMERKELAREHAELTRLRHEVMSGQAKVLCASCQVPVREYDPSRPRSRPRAESAVRNKARRSLLSEADMRASLMDDQSLRKLRVSQEEDAQFLAAEKRYLQRIKQATKELTAK